MMRPLWNKVILIGFLLVLGCRSNPDEMKSRLEGYWEIFEVHKDGKRIKSYTINMNIDYFELITDSTGYRKKVSPTLDGKYIVNDHQTPFFISVKDNKLIIRYQDQGVEYEEIILEVEDELLRIKNEQGFVYSYRPYEPIEIE